MQMSLKVNNQSVESSGITKDYREGLCEYIWNGFEANATEVNISYSVGVLNNINTITISDNGDGIIYEELSNTFGAFLASQKNTLSLKMKSKANKGKGRFSFISFASHAQWNTKYKQDDTIFEYTISLSNSNKQVFDCDEPRKSLENTTGTCVTLDNVFALTEEDMSLEALKDYLLMEFSWYLYLNKHKDLKLVINNEELNYKELIDDNLSCEQVYNIDGSKFTINLIVWKEKIKEKFCCYYFDDKNEMKGKDTTTFNRNTVNFNHSVFVFSPLFNELASISLNDLSDQIEIDQEESTYDKLKKLKKEIQKLIGEKLKEHMYNNADSEI